MEESLFREADSPQLVEKFPTFYGTVGLIPHSQESASCPYPKPDQSGLCTPPTP